MKIKIISIAFLLSLPSVSFAQDNSTGLKFSDYLRQMQEGGKPETAPAAPAAPIAAPEPEAAPAVPIAAPEPEAAPATPIAAPEPVITAPQAPVLLYASYEVFLDRIEVYVNSILPEKEKLEFQKAAVKADSASPKDEFEKGVDYEKRLADFEKARGQRILALEKEYREKVKDSMGKLKSAISHKEDIQPNWEGMLRKNADVEEYKERINKFTDKISKMEDKIARITRLLTGLDFSKEETETLSKRWDKKNLIYIERLGKARELMHDYILQEQAKVLSTDRKKFEMSLGAYNADNEEFEFGMSDIGSQTVPFDFSGTIKIAPQQARETNRQTDNFTASVDYINYPLIVNENKLYPGVKKTHVFYKEQELPTNGIFKEIPDLMSLGGYNEWAVYYESLRSGKLAPRNLDSLYAIGTRIKVASEDTIKESKSGSFWTKRNIIRAAMFGFSAVSLGIGMQQNDKASSKNNLMKTQRSEAKSAGELHGFDSQNYKEKYDKAKKSHDEANESASLRNGFYVGAGVFGLAGVATFYF